VGVCRAVVVVEVESGLCVGYGGIGWPSGCEVSMSAVYGVVSLSRR